MKKFKGIICEDKIHCDVDCPHLVYSSDNECAKCTFKNIELTWYDFWLAECTIKHE